MGLVIAMDAPRRHRQRNAEGWNIISHISDAEAEQRLAAGILRQARTDAREGDRDAAAWLCSDDRWLVLLLLCVTPEDETWQDVQRRFRDELEAA